MCFISTFPYCYIMYLSCGIPSNTPQQQPLPSPVLPRQQMTRRTQADGAQDPERRPPARHQAAEGVGVLAVLGHQRLAVRGRRALFSVQPLFFFSIFPPCFFSSFVFSLLYFLPFFPFFFCYFCLAFFLCRLFSFLLCRLFPLFLLPSSPSSPFFSSNFSSSTFLSVF